MKMRFLSPALMTLIASCGAAQGGCTPAPAPAPVEAPATPVTQVLTPSDSQVIGTSVQGRPIVAERYGNGPSNVVIVTQIHGNEDGPAIVAQAARDHAWVNATVWLIAPLNVDGVASHVRTNANGVDLNRDGGLTQPESQALNSFVHAVNARLIIHVHSPSGYVGYYGSAWARAAAQTIANTMGLPMRGYVANHPFLWVGTGGDNVLVEVPAIDGNDCAGCWDGRQQSDAPSVRAGSDLMMDAIDGVL